ncbi:MAG: response regulator transcription factor [Sphaerochaetaceae bacterium]|nr:response regulator transcription factor [Sphaerochaetaceae bacterium]
MIYCIEDDEDARELMIYALKASGFEVTGFSKAPDFWKKIGETLPDLILLDIMLPGEDGLNVLKNLKSNPVTANIPVIMTTAKGTEFDKVMGLDLGADDYLTKPFGMMELVSRINAVLRRINYKNKDEVLKVGNITLDNIRHKVFVSGKTVSLSLKEYELLRLFMENTGKVYSRNQILEIVWGMYFIGETRTVDVHIGTLRTKLGEDGQCIKTVRGVGYCFEENV